MVMAKRICAWFDSGITVKIVTARAEDPEEVAAIQAWLQEHGLPSMEITNKKDFGMIQLWDDRAVQVEPNTGLRADGQP